MSHWRDERGDIISSWLLQLLIFMAVVAFVGYEVLTMAITGLNLDGDAERVASRAALAYASDHDLQHAEDIATSTAEERQVQLVDLSLDGSAIVVTVTKEANTLLVQHIGFLDRFTHPSATRREKWRP